MLLGRRFDPRSAGSVQRRNCLVFVREGSLSAFRLTPFFCLERIHLDHFII